MSASEILIFSALLLFAIVTGRVEAIIEAIKKVLNIDQLKKAIKSGDIKKGGNGNGKSAPKPPGDPKPPPPIDPIDPEPPCLPGKPC